MVMEPIQLVYVTLQNYGNVDLSAFQVTEDLATTFTGATILVFLQ